MGDPLGPETERARAAYAIVAQGWDVTLSRDVVLEQWRKLLWNVGFNALCAVTGATAGEALAVPESATLVRAAMSEVVALANARGIALTESDVDEMAASNEELRHYRPSTARDLDAGRPSERSALSGFVLREGLRTGVPAPVNEVLDGLLALQEQRGPSGHDRRS